MVLQTLLMPAQRNSMLQQHKVAVGRPPLQALRDRCANCFDCVDCVMCAGMTVSMTATVMPGMRLISLDTGF